jgi:hypothetical protein
MTEFQRLLYEELLSWEGCLLREMSVCARKLRAPTGEDTRLRTAARERVARLLLDAIAREKNVRIPAPGEIRNKSQ